jgi:PAS domain S-box-containing protein
MPVFEDREILTQLGDGLPFGLYMVDRNRKILYWNRTAAAISGYLSPQAVGRSCRDDLLVHCFADGPPICDTAACPLTRTLRSGQPANFRAFLQHRDGYRVPVRMLTIPLRDESGKIVAIAELFQDESATAEELGWLSDARLRVHPVLGIPTPSAAEEQFRIYLAQSPPRLAVFLIAIESLRELAQNRGAEAVDAVVSAVAHTITRLLTVPHFLGCWSDRRFLLLIPNCDPESFENWLRTLKGVSSACGVKWWGDRIVPQVLVAATLVEEQESMETLLGRLDHGSRNKTGSQLPILDSQFPEPSSSG